MRIYKSDQFHFHRDTNTLTAEASDLGLTAAAMGRGEVLHDRVFYDAIDVGFAIRSHLTGKLAVYTLKDTDTKDGDVRAWEYEPARKCESMLFSKGDIAPWDSYKHTKVTIFND